MYEMLSGWGAPEEDELEVLGSSELEGDEDEEQVWDWAAVREQMSHGKGLNAKKMYAYGRMYEDWDDEEGWGGDWKDNWRQYKDDMDGMQDAGDWTPQ